MPGDDPVESVLGRRNVLNNEWMEFRTRDDGSHTDIAAGDDVVLRDDVPMLRSWGGNEAIVLKVNPKTLVIWMDGEDVALNVYPEHIGGFRRHDGRADLVMNALRLTSGRSRYWISHGKRSASPGNRLESAPLESPDGVRD